MTLWAGAWLGGQADAMAPPLRPAPAAEPAPAAKSGPAAKPAPVDKPTVDWRGLDRMDASGQTKPHDKPPPNPVQQLVQNAPYRVYVATTNGTKVVITDAYTLERRRVFVADAVGGYAFSSDGHWLYVVHGGGRSRTVSAVAVNTAKARVLATIRLHRGEDVVEVLGHGDEAAAFVTVVVGRGVPWRAGQGCTKPTHLRRIRLRETKGSLRREEILGAHDLTFPARHRVVSPNTRYTAQLGATLTIHGRFGGDGVGRLNKRPLPAHPLGVRWMRDSRGVFLPIKRPGTCPHLKGLANFRQPQSQFASWRRQHDWLDWRVGENVQLVRGDLIHQDLSWAPDGMRLVGMTTRGVVLVEPLVRHADHISLIAPPSTLWPAVRPGVRTIASGSGELRHAEILLEQGSLDAAEARLRGAPVGQARARLLSRLAKLRSVLARRTAEFAALQDAAGGASDSLNTVVPPATATPATR